jgi:hypothetical protein
MATARECTIEEQGSVVRFFLWAKGINAKDIHKEMFSVMVRNVCRIKWLCLDG